MQCAAVRMIDVVSADPPHCNNHHHHQCCHHCHRHRHHRNTTITIIIKIGSDHHDEEGSHQVVVAKVGADLKSCNERKFSIFRRLRLQCISIRIMIIMNIYM